MFVCVYDRKCLHFWSFWSYSLHWFSLSEENKTENLSLICLAHTVGCSLFSLSLPPLLSTRSLIIFKVNVLYCYIACRSSSQTTTFEKLTGSLFLAFLASSLGLFLPVRSLEVNVLSRYTMCLSSSQTVTLEKWIGSISTSWRTRGAQLLRKKAVVFSALCCTENN